jgi:hypothetical protein
MPVTMPSTTAFVTSSFFLETNTQTFESPLNRVTQRLELQGQRWRATWTLPPMSKANAAPWIAFFMKLKGTVNTFTASDPDWQTNLGAWSGTPLVKGASQTGNSLIIDGCTAGVTGWAKAGDYFNVSGKLRRVTADANSNGSGEVTLSFEPPIYTAPADNAAITKNPATVEMRLLDDGAGEWESGIGNIYSSKTFSAVEAL